MAKPQNLEVYRDWLGITDTNRPLSYYQLLRLKKFEDDTSLIRAHYQRMNAHVRKFQTVEPERVQTLLDELTKAMLCLTDTHRKGDYDGTLGRAGAADRKKRSLEDLLLTRKILDQEQLKKAQNLANAIGVDLRDAVMQQKLAKPEVVMQAYADSLGLPFLDLSLIQINADLVPKMPAVLARQHSCVPLLIDDEKVIVASPNPLRQEVEDEVRLRFGMTVKTVLCTPADIHEAINKYFPKEAAAAQIGVALPSAGAVKDTKPKMAPAERLKRRKQFAMLGFMMTFMAFGVLGGVMGWSGAMGLIKFYSTGALLAAVAAGIGWFSG
jgi:hypothetical protein